MPINITRRNIIADEEHASSLSKKEIKDIAEAYAEILYKPLEDDIKDVVTKKLNGSFTEFNPFINQDISGSLEVDMSNETFSITLSQFTSNVRDNFTIAHELGHLFLHCNTFNDGELVHFKRFESNRLEWEANWFAGSFLMPKNIFERVCVENEYFIPSIAIRFGVSEQAVTIRMKELGIGGV